MLAVTNIVEGVITKAIVEETVGIEAPQKRIAKEIDISKETNILKETNVTKEKDLPKGECCKRDGCYKEMNTVK